MESGFSLIIANFRRGKLEAVEKCLESLGVERINVSHVGGFGEYHNYYARNWLQDEVRVEIFTKRHEVEAVVSAIIETARSGHTGYPGDGVLAVLPIEKLYLIRTASEATDETFWPKRQQEQAGAALQVEEEALHRGFEFPVPHGLAERLLSKLRGGAGR